MFITETELGLRIFVVDNYIIRMYNTYIGTRFKINFSDNLAKKGRMHIGR